MMKHVKLLIPLEIRLPQSIQRTLESRNMILLIWRNKGFLLLHINILLEVSIKEISFHIHRHSHSVEALSHSAQPTHKAMHSIPLGSPHKAMYSIGEKMSTCGSY